MFHLRSTQRPFLGNEENFLFMTTPALAPRCVQDRILSVSQTSNKGSNPVNAVPDCSVITQLLL